MWVVALLVRIWSAMHFASNQLNLLKLNVGDRGLLLSFAKQSFIVLVTSYSVMQLYSRGPCWWIQRLMDPRVDGSKGWWIQGSMDPRVDGSKGWWIQGLMDPTVDGSNGQWIQGLMDPRVDGSKGWWIQWSRVDGSNGQWIQGLMDPTVNGSKGQWIQKRYGFKTGPFRW